MHVHCVGVVGNHRLHQACFSAWTSVEEASVFPRPFHMYRTLVSQRDHMYHRRESRTVSDWVVRKGYSGCCADMVQDKREGRVGRHNRCSGRSYHAHLSHHRIHTHPPHQPFDIAVEGPDCWREGTIVSGWGHPYLQRVTDRVTIVGSDVWPLTCTT